MSTVFDETIQEVHDEKSAAAGEAPETSEIPSTETLAPEPETPAQETVAETTTGEGAAVVEKAATEEDTQFNLTGLETPEDLSQRHGEGWAVKTARRFLPLVKEAGGSVRDV